MRIVTTQREDGDRPEDDQADEPTSVAEMNAQLREAIGRTIRTIREP